MSDYVLLALSLAGPCCFLLLQVSVVQTALEMIKSAQVNGLSPLTFISLFVNCVIWSLYGFGINDSTVFIPNAIGTIVGLFCSVIFHLYCEVSQLPYSLYIVSAIVIVFVLVLYSTNDFENIGYTGVVVSILLTGSPLSVLKHVIKEKSTQRLPFNTTVLMCGNSISWLLYGIYVNKIAVIIPNFIGLVLTLAQLSLFAIYGFSKSTGSNRKAVHVSSKEDV